MQLNGESAVSIVCENAVPSTTVFLGTTPLATTYGGATWVTALVPADLYRCPGRHQVRLVSRYAVEKIETDVSTAVDFVVEP